MRKINDLAGLVIGSSSTVRAAMEMINKSGARIVYIVADDKKLVGALNDGDIRRHILSGGKLSDGILQAANLNCHVLYDESQHVAEEFLKEKRISCVPIIDGAKQIKFLWALDNFLAHSNKGKVDLPVVINAGGLGTRLYPYTQVLPKALIPVGEKPITELIIESFLEYGCTKFYMIVNHKKNMIKAYYAEVEKKYNLTFIDEDTPLGTAGGLSLLKGRINQPFFFTNCDTLLDAEYDNIYKVHKERKNIVTVISAMKHYKIPFGVLELDNAGSIEKFVEKPGLDYIVNTGAYLLDSKIIDELKPNEFISMPEVIQRIMSAGKPVGVYPIAENCWNDMGQLDELEKMQAKLRGGKL